MQRITNHSAPPRGEEEDSSHFFVTLPKKKKDRGVDLSIIGREGSSTENPIFAGGEKSAQGKKEHRRTVRPSMHATHEYPSTRRPSIIQYRTYERPLLSWHVTP